MGIPTTYAELKTEVLNWLNRPELTNDVATFITFAENKINRISRLSEQETTAAVVMTINQDYTTLPTGFLEHISLKYNDQCSDPQKTDLATRDRAYDSNTIGLPGYFAISNNRYYWDYKPDSAYALTARYWKKWNIASDLTNSLLTNNPDIYLYASLAHAASFIDHPKQQAWELAAKDCLDQLEYQSTKLRKSLLRVDQALIGGARSNIISGD